MGTSLPHFLALALLLGASGILAQERLIDREPFDRITVKDGQGEHTFEIELLVLPGGSPRKLPKDPAPSEKIAVKLLQDDEGRQFEVAWRDITKLELYEEMVLVEANRLTNSQSLDEAYTFFEFLTERYPKLPRLNASIQSFWYVSAGVAFRNQRNAEALALMEQLLTENPQFKAPGGKGVTTVFGGIVDRVIEDYVRKKDFLSARQILFRVSKAYSIQDEPFFKKWSEQLESLAAKQRDLSKKALDEKRFNDAYEAASEMYRIWPKVSGAYETYSAIVKAYPIVTVGVTNAKGEELGNPSCDWAARRVSKLIDATFTEFRGIGAEGGTYSFAFGRLEVSEDGMQSRISLEAKEKEKPNAPSVETVAGWLTRLASPGEPGYSPEWASIVRDTRAARGGTVIVQHSRPHLIPPALLRVSMRPFSESMTIPPTPYRVGKSSAPNVVQFIANENSWAFSVGQPREIVEKYFEDPQRAVIALRQGKIDAIDRVSVFDVEELATDPEIAVGEYATPTMTILVPNYKRPFPSNVSFRRAFVYGLPRQGFLDQIVLRNRESPGSAVLSGPFPAPRRADDPLAYAYDENVPPLAYDPLLATTLFIAASKEVANVAQNKGEEPPKALAITIGYPRGEVAEAVCKAISRQLDALGVKCEIIGFEGGDFRDRLSKCDFLYTELSMQEPAVDSVRFFSDGGDFAGNSAYVRLGARRVGEARTWRDAAQRLRDLHRLTHEDVTVVPLWQTYERYAYRKTIQGLSATYAGFYDDVSSWRIVRPRQDE